MELILSNASILKGSCFSINRDYPREIVDARRILFREKRDIKSEKPDSKVTIKYPAKLVVDGLTVKDMFPDWFPTLKKIDFSPHRKVRLLLRKRTLLMNLT